MATDFAGSVIDSGQVTLTKDFHTGVRTHTVTFILQKCWIHCAMTQIQRNLQVVIPGPRIYNVYYANAVWWEKQKLISLNYERHILPLS